jgi:hypothetical protein
MVSGPVRRYYGVAHVRWELPFLLRLPPNAFLCWEPQERFASIVSLARVGAVQWHRTSRLLSSQQALEPHYPFVPEPSESLPTRDYRLAAVIQ